MTYRDDLEALAHRRATLAREVEAKARELAQASIVLEDARARSRLPVLDNVRVASPCNVSWAGMTGDDRVRHCQSCNKNVFNLSQMTREEAESLIVEKAGKLCVRYYQRADGTILLGDDCKVGTRRKRARIALIAGAAATALGSAAVTYQVMAGPGGEQGWVQGGLEDPGWTQGRVAVPEPVVPHVLDDSGIRRGMYTVLPSLRECAAKFPVHGELQLDVRVAPAGLIEEVTVARSLTQSYDLEACLVSAMHDAKFDRSETGGIFSYPLVF